MISAEDWTAAVNEDLTTAGNWSGGVVPNGQDAIFDANVGTNSPTLTSSTLTVSSFQFQAAVSSFNFTIQNILTFNGVDGVINNSSSTQTFSIGTGGSIIFDDGYGNGGPGSVVYKVLSGGTLTFTPDSSTYNITINGEGGTINIEDGAGTFDTNVALTDGSILNIGLNTLSQITSDSTSTINLDDIVTLLNGFDVAGIVDGTGGISLSAPVNGIFESTAMTNYTGTTDIASGSSLTFDQTTAQNFASPLTDAGNVFINSPNITFTGNSSAFTGVTTINSGANLILENILGGDVADSGTLTSPSGTILGDFAIHPGGRVFLNSPTASLTVDGAYTQTGGTLETTVNAAGQSAFLDVGGALTLSGSTTLLIDSSDGFAMTYHIAHAGSVTGTFSSVVASNMNAQPMARYTATDIYVDFGTTFSTLARTFNERQVASQLDGYGGSDPALAALITALSALSPDAAALALDQMTGQQYATTLLTTEFENDQFLRELYDPLRPFIADPCALGCCVCNTWAEATVGHAHWFGTANASSIAVNEYEVTLGAQKGVSRQVLLGAALSYAHEDISYKVVGGHGTSNSALGSLYGLYRHPCFYVLGDLILGYTHQTVRRKIDVGALSYRPKGSANIFQSALYFESGKDFWFKGILIQPFAGIEAGCYANGTIRESTGTPVDLTVKHRGYWPAYSRLGVHFSKLCSTFFIGIDTAWQYRLTSSQNHIEENFNGFGTPFPIHGFHLTRNAFDGDLYIGKAFGCGSYFIQGGIQTGNNLFAYEGLIGVNFKL